MKKITNLILLGDYQKVVDKLLPNALELDKRGFIPLVFALEELGRGDEAIALINEHELSKNDSDIMGVLGGRFKRKYLKEFIKTDGKTATKYYEQALLLAQKNNDSGQIYYHAINLAFLSLIQDNDKTAMRKFAQQALNACEGDDFDSLWSLATIAEANLYLGNKAVSKDFYKRAAAMAGQREKISIHTNAYTAYTTLFNTDNQDDPFIRFLKEEYLS